MSEATGPAVDDYHDGLLLGGHSTIWLARAVQPEGSVVTCEIDPHHARVATENVARAGLAEMPAAAERVDATVIQTMDGKGYDGLALAVVKA